MIPIHNKVMISLPIPSCLLWSLSWKKFATIVLVDVDFFATASMYDGCEMLFSWQQPQPTSNGFFFPFFPCENISRRKTAPTGIGLKSHFAFAFCIFKINFAVVLLDISTTFHEELVDITTFSNIVFYVWDF